MEDSNDKENISSIRWFRAKKKAVNYASDLALKYDATVYLLHVIQESQIPEGLDSYMRAEHLEQPKEQVYLEKLGNGIIESGKNQTKGKGVDNVKTVLATGNPSEKILEFAKSNGIDMIVMGSRGLGGVKSLFLGSVSNKVCHLAECTCMTVK